jgi:hypothetical protein
LARVIDDFDAALKADLDAIAAEDQEGLRIATIPGLRIVFSVSEQDRIVNVVVIREVR